jgi:5-methyltetrahydrofolate--homocysteine methyltransferase
VGADGGRPGAIAPTTVPTPPFWGAREVRVDWRALDQLLPFVDRNVLFRHHWGYRKPGMSKADWDAMARSDLEPLLASLWRDAKVRRWLEPMGTYGYFPCRARGDSVVVFDAAAFASGAREGDLPVVAAFGFPRQTDDGSPRTRDRLCISDYFVDGHDGAYDIIALQVVTAGRKAGDHAQALMAGAEYDRGLKVHGIASAVAEGFADWLNARVRTELGLVAPRARRYSWGYGACPDVSDQASLVRLLPAVTGSMGMTLTAGFQWDPEQSTAAFIVHHPQATYFNVLERPDDAPLDGIEGE